MVKIKGIAVYPTAIEDVLRGFPEMGNDYRIIVDVKDGQDEVIVQAEKVDDAAGPEHLQPRVTQELKAKVGVTCRVELLPSGGLSQGQDLDRWIKSRRLIDRRPKD